MADFLGGTELIILLLVGLLLVGPKKLVEMARWLGKAVAEFRKAMAELPENPITPSKESFILDAASRLGLNTRGKSIDRIVQDMVGFLEDYKELRPSTPTPATVTTGPGQQDPKTKPIDEAKKT